MDCIECDGKTRVTDSIAYAGTVYRHRKCLACGLKFWTEEIVAENKYDIRDALSFKKAKYRDNKRRLEKC